MAKFFVLATKTVELRGFVTAATPEKAKIIAEENWHIYDHPEMAAVLGGTSQMHAAPPIIAEHQAKIKILHIDKMEDKNGL